MSLEPLKIPQNVYIEDRIVGPVTLRQIILLGIGGGFSYVIWAGFAQANGGTAPLPLTIIACIPLVITAAFAFVKINDLSLMRILLLMIEGMNKPKTRSFSPRQGFSIHIRTFSEPSKHNTPTVIPEKQQSAQHLDDLTAILDRPLTKPVAPVAPAMPPEAADEQEVTVRTSTPEQAPISTLPVNKDRIKVSPLPAGVQGTNSLFRDIVSH